LLDKKELSDKEKELKDRYEEILKIEAEISELAEKELKKDKKEDK